MKQITLVLGLLGLLTLTGCLVSLHPIYTDQDLASDPDLKGIWRHEDITWDFSDGNQGKYKLVYTEKDREATFVAHLVNLDGVLFLDLYPDTAELVDKADSWRVPDFYLFHLFPVHTFLRVHQITPSLRLATISLDWLNDYLKAHPRAVDHERIPMFGKKITVFGKEGFVVLTGSTKKLQRLLIKANKKGAFYSEDQTIELVLKKIGA